MKKVGIVWLVYTGIIFFLSVVGGILSGFVDYDFSFFTDFVKVMCVIWLIISLILCLGIIIQTYYFRALTKKKNADEMILLYSEMLDKPFKLFFVNDPKVIIRNLGLIYLMKNDIAKARESFKELGDVTRDFFCFYPRFILGLYDNNVEEAAKNYYKLMKSKNHKLDMQKEMATKLKQMVESKAFDEKIYEETQYEIIKEICLRYKK